MNAVSLAIASIRSRPLHALLCTVAMSAGIALLTAVFLISQGLSSGFVRNASGIDIVVGTKGSPLQLVLSSIYHVDIPAGNITIGDYKKLKQNRRIRQAVPLALGDSYKGFRVVGTEQSYLALYRAELEEGRFFSKNFETVAGAGTGVSVGDRFAVTHGFSANSHAHHDEQLYTVTGLLKPTGTALDRLFVTTIESVQQLHSSHAHHETAHEEGEYAHDDEHHAHEEHDHHDAHAHDDEHDHAHEEHGHDDEHSGHAHAEHGHYEDNHDAHAHDDGHHVHEEGEHHAHIEHEQAHEHTAHDQDNSLSEQITAILIKVRSPLDLMNLPRQINSSSNIMAAVPSYEIARLTKSLGLGRQLLLVVGGGFVLLSVLMLLASLMSGLALRRYDLAVLRVLGGSPRRLFETVIAEGLILSGIGAVLGVFIGHFIAYSMAVSIESLKGMVLPSALLQVNIMDLGFVVLGLGIGFVASFIPSFSAARMDIAGLLARGRV